MTTPDNPNQDESHIPRELHIKWQRLISDIRRLSYEAGKALALESDYSVQYIRHLSCSLDDDDRKTLLLDDDFHPTKVDLRESASALVDLIAPANRALNSLPRWAGHIIVINPQTLQIITELNGAKSALSSDVSAWLKSLKNTGGNQHSNIRINSALRRANLLNNENYELAVRTFDITDHDMPVHRLQSRWRCNHYSQQGKTTVGNLIQTLESMESPGPQELAAIEGLCCLAEDRFLVKRFYSPPTIASRIRYGENKEWSAYWYNALPIIVSNVGTGAVMKSELPPLNTYMNDNGDIRAHMKAHKAALQPLKLIYKHWYLTHE